MTDKLTDKTDKATAGHIDMPPIAPPPEMGRGKESSHPSECITAHSRIIGNEKILLLLYAYCLYMQGTLTLRVGHLYV